MHNNFIHIDINLVSLFDVSYTTIDTTIRLHESRYTIAIVVWSKEIFGYYITIKYRKLFYHYMKKA